MTISKEQIKRSGQLIAPSMFTMGNMACGFYALLATHLGDYKAAATCILGGILFDMLDGRVARLVHGESEFGIEFDSLSDFLTFGVAPGYMMCAIFLKDYGPVGYMTAFVYALCGGLRLARFNAAEHAGKGSKSNFQGLPIPAAAGCVASLVLLYEMVEQGSSRRTLDFVMWVVPVIAGIGPFFMIALSFLMVSNIPYGAFKQKDALNPQNIKLMLLVAVTMVLLYIYPENAVFLIFASYVVSGLTGLVFNHAKD